MNQENDDQVTSHEDVMISRRKMLSLGLAGGAAAILGGANPAFAATPPPPGTLTANPHYVCVTDYGAVPNVRTLAQAQANTIAFRKACASALSDYQMLTAPLEIYVPAGDWFLSDGFALPIGCTLRGAGFGATYLIIPSAFNSTPKAVIAVGAATDQNGNYVASYTSVGVGEAANLLPPSVVDGVFINTPGTGIECHCAGWLIQNIWLIAQIGVLVANDGILSNIVVDFSSLNGVIFSGAQNVLVNNLYVFGSNFGVTFSNSNNNIRFNNSQFVYTNYSPIFFGEQSTNNNIHFDGLSISYNLAPSTFIASVYLRSIQTQLNISNALFSNQPGNAISIGLLGDKDRITLNNCTFDGNPSNPVYQSNSTKVGGIAAGNCDLLEINGCQFLNLGQPALTIGSNYGPVSNLVWNGGLIKNYTGAGTPVQMTFQSRTHECFLIEYHKLRFKSHL